VRRRNRSLSLQAVQLLAVLLDDPTGEYWGSDLGQRVGLLSGTVYPLLRRLEDKGWLASRWEDVDPAAAGRPRRRLYRLTGQGEAAARAELARVKASLIVVNPATGLT
jgi:PadR family transcriptional regulator, regulatory protein PadR